MRTSEIFHSVQGEGGLAGTPSVFVRTTGCNLRCWFCDTPYTSWEPEGVQRDWRDVVDQVAAYDCEHVVVTGGEPMLQPDVVPLTHAFRALEKFITIETAGTVYRPVHCELMSISPKLSNSAPDDPLWGPRHEQLRENREVIARLICEFDCQLKFVIDRPEDVAEVDEYLRAFSQIAADRVFLMPQGITEAELFEKTPWIAAAARERGWRVSPRLHIELFGNARGT